ncbi:rhodanese-like domain-containing protein 11, chloroplastic isoform X3 [Ziziphus jujuba]|uniref:Rhodanese-like domain-containing protein 11, chloroplastic isoform X3 n=1 Tax=Ziziphus jujuba TaxID=326968 RepID=A0ABM3IL30_ZIZJJ|nr:rhodanese-like domain-containing protein 11, chloroplastic isoform X3 [Ziziphus jujuba]
MEALGLPCLNTISLSCCSNSVSQKQKLNHFFSKGTFCRNTYGLSSSSSPKLMPTYGTRRFQWRTIRMQADDEDYELKQTKDMTAARKRWEALAWVKGSTWIPIFEVDNRLDPGTVSRKITSFVMGGWWSGVPTLTYDSRFLSKVEEKFPKETDLIVACQKGLRSLAACELLYNAGYRNLFWLQGGLESAEEEDLIREGPLPFKFAGIGGVSEFLGWTDQQRAAAAREGWGYRLLFSARLVGVFIVVDALFIGAQRVAQYLQELKSQ